VQAQDDVLIVIAETLAEDIHAAQMLGVFVEGNRRGLSLYLRSP
jgi:hypothetical protein